MNIENDMPQSFIISETKINTQSVESAVDAATKSKWSDKWKKRNLNNNVTDLEKIPEIAAEISGKLSNDDKSTDEYNKFMLPYLNEEDIFSHTSITVAFVNVTRQFCYNFRGFDGAVTVGDLNENMTFWVPPSVSVNEKLAVQYGNAINELGQSIETMRRSSLENNLDTVNKIYEAFDNLYPNSASVNCVCTGNLVEWKKFIVANSQFHSSDESRYVFMNLVRLMKIKWSSLFYDIVLEDPTGKQYGLDTINASPLAFKAFRISVKRLD
jgi:hypothetical protein